MIITLNRTSKFCNINKILIIKDRKQFETLNVTEFKVLLLPENYYCAHWVPLRHYYRSEFQEVILLVGWILSLLQEFASE